MNGLSLVCIHCGDETYRQPAIGDGIVKRASSVCRPCRAPKKVKK